MASGGQWVGRTGRAGQAELADPATYWVEVGLVAFTQTLASPPTVAAPSQTLFAAAARASLEKYEPDSVPSFDTFTTESSTPCSASCASTTSTPYRVECPAIPSRLAHADH